MTTNPLSESMPALVWEAPRRMALHTQSLPTLQADEVLIKVAFAGICGSELSGYLGHNALRVPPLVMGHEFSGEIVARGEAVTDPQLALGTPVTANPMVYCGECDYCQSGRQSLCVQRRLVGAHRPGAFAGYVSIPARQVLPLPENVSLVDGALAEPVACAARIVELAGVGRGETVFVAGAGTIGLLTLQILLHQGAGRVFITDVDALRLAAAGELGGEALNPRAVEVVKTVREATGKRGVAASVDAVGLALTREQCVSATCTGGTLILSGLHEETSAMPVADMIRREIVARGCFAYSRANFAYAVQLLAQGAVRLSPWVVTAPLAEGGQWFDRLVEGASGAAKILLTP